MIGRKRGTQGPSSETSLAVRWGEWAARHRWKVLAVWGALLLASAAAYPHLVNSLAPPDYSVTGSDSDKVADTIESDFTAAGAEQDVVVFKSETLTIEDPGYQEVVDRVTAAGREQPGVVYALGPTEPGAQGQVSADGTAALTGLGLSGDDRERADRAESIQDAVAETAGDGPVEAYLTGFSPSSNDLTEVETADTERAESFGLPVAFIVLLLALAAVVAASVPLLTAVISLTFTLGVLSLLITVTPFEADAFLLSIVTMIGVGVAIDYSLFVLTRFREELARGEHERRPDAVAHATGIAMTTSGRTIAFSGVIVMISLLSLFVVKSPMFQGIALGAALVVSCTLVTAWTMLPAFLAALGDRVNRWSLPERFQPAEEEEGAAVRPGGWERWARTVLAHSWLGIPAAALLILFALPTLIIKLGIDMGLSAVADSPSGKAEIILADSFTEGVMSPVQILVSHEGPGRLSAADLTTIDELTTSLSKDPRVTDVYSISELLRQTTGDVSPQALAALEQEPAARDILAQ